MEDTYGLNDIAAEIADLHQQLNSAYERRSQASLQALSDGHSLREIAELLGVSHTMVAKAVAGG